MENKCKDPTFWKFKEILFIVSMVAFEPTISTGDRLVIELLNSS